MRQPDPYAGASSHLYESDLAVMTIHGIPQPQSFYAYDDAIFGGDVP